VTIHFSLTERATDAQPAEYIAATKADLYQAAWASSLGSALEYYDFALYGLPYERLMAKKTAASVSPKS